VLLALRGGLVMGGGGGGGASRREGRSVRLALGCYRALLCWRAAHVCARTGRLRDFVRVPLGRWP
jgi:hypothetical protein